MQDRQKPTMDRRNFLRAVGGASTVAAATVAVALRPGEAAAYDPGPEETKGRYNPESADVKAFYRVNGYQTLKK